MRQVEDTTYSLPIAPLRNRSAKFASYVEARTKDQSLGCDDAHAIVLDGVDVDGAQRVSKREFESLLGYVYGHHWCVAMVALALGHAG